MAFPEPKIDESSGHWETYKDHYNHFIKRVWCSHNSSKKVKLKSTSDFIVANQDVKTGDIIEFLDAGKYNTLPSDPSKEVLTFKIKLPSGEEKSISINKTSQNELSKAWTDESNKWVGQKARVDIVRQQVYDKQKDVIYLYPAEGDTNPPVPEDIPGEDIPIVE